MKEKFEIPEIIKKSYPKLIKLILEARSMNDEEKQYWFRILPIVKKEHVKKLFKILITEKKELEKIDLEYNKNMLKIQESREDYNQEMLKEKKNKLKEKELEHEKEEALLEDELLKELEQFSD